MSQETKQPEKSTLSVGNYSIELSDGPSHVYLIDAEGNRQWVCATTDPERAMAIVEGLVLVEMKRFYHPESTPTITPNTKESPVPPFLKGDKS
jgi:hypothetical protein